MELLSAVDLHPNIVSLLGVCAEPRAVDANGSRIGVGLMLEMANMGTVYDLLRNESALAKHGSWNTRAGLLADAACGMAALHAHTPPIVHRDLKSLNVLVCDVVS